MDNFNVKKWLFENKVTINSALNSALISEREVDLGGPNDTRPEFDAGSDDPAMDFKRATQDNNLPFD